MSLDAGPFAAEAGPFPPAAALTAQRSAPGWPLAAAIGTAAGCICVALAELVGVLARSTTMSLAAYFVALGVGTPFVGLYRWIDGDLSKKGSWQSSRALQRVAILAAVLIVVACALCGFIVSTAWSKR